MKKLAPLFVLLAACGESTGTEQATKADPECTFRSTEKPQCAYTAGSRSVEVSLVTRKIADDEIELTRASVLVDGKTHSLKISPDTSMIEGAIGTIIFDDISFDGIPDLAVATSFGAANQYLDYWIYDPTAKEYRAVGNLPRLTVDPKAKTLRAKVKVNAASYETQVFTVVGGKLERRK